ncbi:protein kinase domain-containing protein [Yinghuangia seranimata]|uniref:serine/threonine-protein kinase n=1 Tax=Yinghuangia seranimata TaxID=408067 RepID=UPI00248BC39B|nr:serine/threonine-protein kinase [Yinghuangia seranimata]MDI2131346.1 protein kinase [Yinghuangia seranimata]
MSPGRGTAWEAGDELAGRYRLQRRLGNGAMGEVWRALDLTLDRRVAVKTLLAGKADDQWHRALARFRREAKAGARFSHPRIAAVHDFVEHQDPPFLVLELLAGPDLAAHLREHPAGLPMNTVLEYGAQAAEGLAAAHTAGVVHRDIKPHNLMLDDSGAVKICDFGIARLDDATAGLTLDGTVPGTPAYMAPEQLTGNPATAAADVYALGATLFQLLTGRVVFPNGGVYAALYEEPPPPSSLRPAVPEAVDTYLLALLAKDPSARPPARTIPATLRALVEDSSDRPPYAPWGAGVTLQLLNSEALQELGLRTPPPLPRLHPLDASWRPEPFQPTGAGLLLIGGGAHLQAVDVSAWRAEWTIPGPEDDEVLTVCSRNRVAYIPESAHTERTTPEMIRCVDPLTGRTLWSRPIPRPGPDTDATPDRHWQYAPDRHIYHAASPSVIVTAVGDGEVTVWDTETGNVRWSVPLGRIALTRKSSFFSPLILGEHVVYSDAQTATARRLRDGHVVWSSPLWNGYVSGRTLAGQILLEQGDRVDFIDARTGRTARSFELDAGTSAINVIPSPRCLVMDVYPRTHNRTHHKECRELTGELRWRTPVTESTGGFLRFLGDALIWSRTVGRAGDETVNSSFVRLNPDTGAALWGCSFIIDKAADWSWDTEVVAVGNTLLLTVAERIYRIG